MQTSYFLRIILVAGFMAVFAPMAAAHPHVWVTVRAQAVFNAKSEITALRHTWTFDEMYSAFVTEEQGKDGRLMTKEELAPLAKTNVESLAEFDYFTFAKAAGQIFSGLSPGTDFGIKLASRVIVACP
jgi:ABC-type uncharacterized transport system substrate-binding protein